MAFKTWPHMACSFTTPLESRLSTFAKSGEGAAFIGVHAYVWSA